MRALGIDPGTVATGWGVVEPRGTRLAHVASGTLRVDARTPLAQRLGIISRSLVELIARWQPMAMSLEEAFVARNVQSALRLGEARAAALLAAAHSGVEVFEYSPAAVKLAVTGYGAAGKEQVARSVALLLGLARPPACDAADALAAAICHCHSAVYSKRAGAERRLRRRPRRRQVIKVRG